MRLVRAASIEDLRAIAARKVPRFAFDFVDGGAEDEINLSHNDTEFARVKLCPRYLVDVSTVSTEVELFGRTYGAPLGIAPMGFLNMIWPGADLAVARLAARCSIPHVISTASSTRLETLAEAADGNAWFQAYPTREDALIENMLSRATTAGIDVVLVTVDVSQPGKRDRDVRNGLEVPFRITPAIALDLLTHPSWSLGTLRDGPPGFGNFAQEDRRAHGSMTIAQMQARVIGNDLTWDDLARWRERWPGKMLLKGVMHAADGAKAIALGLDGLVVSNHGGRQADYAPSSIAALPEIVAAVGTKVPVLLDSGVRRGSDAVRAKALGAAMCLCGRAFAYGAGAGGDAGVARAFEIMAAELSRAVGQLGYARFADIDAAALWNGEAPLAAEALTMAAQ